MAITKTIEIDVNTLQAVGGLDNLDKALKKVDKSATDVNASFEEVYGDLKPLTARMGEAEDRLYELALAGQSASQEYKELLASVGNYRRVQMQTDMVVDAAATTFDTKLGGALQGATSAFAGVQGAMALTGGQSEELEQAILKVQGAMALAEGVRGVREGMVAFRALGVSAKVALAGIRTGIAATGIGLLVLALGAVVAYWDDIKSAVSGVSSEQEKLNELAATNLTAEQGKLDAIGGQENILKLQGKSEKDILKIKIAQTDQVIKATENQIAQNEITAKAQIAASQRNRDILSGIIKFIQMPLSILLSSIDAVGDALGQNFGLAKGFDDLINKGASLIFDPEAERKKADEVQKEAKKGLEKLKNDRAGLQLSLNNIDAQAAKDAAAKQDEKNKKAAEDKQKELEELQKQKDAVKQIEENNLKAIEDLKAKTEVEKVALQKSRDLAELDALKLSLEEKAKARLAIEEKYKILDGEAKVKDKETKDKDEEDKKIKDKEDREKRLEEEKKFNEELITAENNLQTAKRDAILGGLEVLQQFAGKSKAVALGILAIQKGLAIAEVISNASKGIAVSNANLATVPAILPPGVPNPAYPLAVASNLKNIAATKISAATSIATILAQTVASAKTTLGGGGGGGSAPASGGGTQAPAPSFNVVGNSGVNQIAQTLGNQQPVQAYVVANNVTTQQSLDRNIVNNASL